MVSQAEPPDRSAQPVCANAGTRPEEIFVGRERLLREICRPADPDSATLHWVHGPAGVGKSALLREAGRLLAAEGWDVRSGPETVDLPSAMRGPRDGSGGRAILLDGANPDALPDPASWLPVPAGGVLILCASRRRAPSSWQQPSRGLRLREHRLGALCAPSALAYARAAGATDADALDAHRRTAGYPLLLALLADSRLDPDSLYVHAAACIAQDLAWPGARDALDALALLLRASHDALDQVLGRRCATAEYEALAQFSGAALCGADLSLDPSVATVLRAALRVRSPERARGLFERAEQSLDATASAERDLERRARGIHQLAVLAKERASAEAHPGLAAVWPPDLYLASAAPADAPRLLDAVGPAWSFLPRVIREMPGAVQTVRFASGLDAAHQVLLPLEWLHRHGPAAALDLVLGARSPGALAPLAARGALAIARPPFRQSGPDAASDLVERVLDAGALAAAQGAPLVLRNSARAQRDRLVLHGWQRPADLPEHLLVHDGGRREPVRSAAGTSPSALEGDEVRSLLRHLHHTDYLADFARRKGWAVGGSDLRDLLLGTLIADEVPRPLTGEHQFLLRVAFLERPGNADAVALRLAVSRTTYYRQLSEALRFFGLAFRP